MLKLFRILRLVLYTGNSTLLVVFPVKMGQMASLGGGGNRTAGKEQQSGNFHNSVKMCWNEEKQEEQGRRHEGCKIRVLLANCGRVGEAKLVCQNKGQRVPKPFFLTADRKRSITQTICFLSDSHTIEREFSDHLS